MHLIAESKTFYKYVALLQCRRVKSLITVRFLACNGCSAWRALGTAKTVTRVP